YRTNAALINAYIHQDMARYLYKADEEVRNRRCKYPLLIVHATGGVARVAKTKALDTCDSGPAAGMLGAAFLARKYGLENVVTVDVGGTSTDIGLIFRGEPSYNEERKISGVSIKERFIESISIGGGGSSKARLQGAARQLRVGPESAGAIPGPACYGLGGTSPTVTDAWVALGYIDPNYFLGGRRKLDAAKARAIIKDRIATPLNMTVEQAAEAMVNKVNTQSAISVKEFVESKGVKMKDTAMFAFGGAGGLSASGIARAAGIPTIYVFPFGSAFCAFGSSCTDVLHNYSTAKSLALEPNKTFIKEFNTAIQEMADDAYFDMAGEGFQKDQVSLSLGIVVNSEDSPSSKVIRWASAFLKNTKDIETLLNQYQSETKTAADSKVFIKELRLKASSNIADPHFPSYAPVGTSPEKALKGRRQAYWEGKFQDAHIYEESRLECGNVVRGLAIIESASTSVLVPPGSRYAVDQYLNGVIEEE
ncbi:MAG TPA: hydantoinase/oxoprolinase family protein, partial [Dehalococcoidales bacterium]|nr:hydantoinase/oxoprolinase family protein [Dehalococcoidales bacterium]